MLTTLHICKWFEYNRSFWLSWELGLMFLWKVFQSASLCLTTTTPEELAFALRWFMLPLTHLGVPVAEIILTLMLSLRFISLVFDEVGELIDLSLKIIWLFLIEDWYWFSSKIYFNWCLLPSQYTYNLLVGPQRCIGDCIS